MELQHAAVAALGQGQLTRLNGQLADAIGQAGGGFGAEVTLEERKQIVHSA